MIVRDYCSLSHPDAVGANYGTRAKCEEWRDRDPLRRPPESYVIEPVSYCACCGDDFSAVRDRGGSIATYSGGITRCDRHWDRNPYVVPGCSRTRAAPERDGGPGHWLADDQVICGEHWRRYVPPRSSLRRAYHRFWRLAKRQATPDNPHGWTMGLSRRFDRFWRGLVAHVRRKATEGHLDEAEINRLFGWASED